MTQHADRLTDAAIADLLRSRTMEPDLGLLDAIVRTAEATPQVRPWFGIGPVRLPRMTLLLVASALLLAAMGAIGVGTRLLQPDPLVLSFGGTWISTSDPDGGLQTMQVEFTGDVTVDVTVHDTIASVCSGTPSTLTGAGRIERGTRLIVPEPTYLCDDGSQAQAMSGPPLEEQLRNWTLVLDPETGTLVDEVVVHGFWHRDGAALPSPDPSTGPPSPDPSTGPAVTGQMWPQTTIEEVRRAQELADAGDPRYTWQAHPLADDPDWPDAEILRRFFRDGLGWEEFDFAHGYFFRCAPGVTNPLYPDDPVGGSCAPTIDDLHYETVVVGLEQLVDRGPSGIWVVTHWQMLEAREPFGLSDLITPDFTHRQLVQARPPSPAEVEDLAERFLQARVSGAGAEQYVLSGPAGSSFEAPEIPLLYATADGTAYERFEVERVRGPVWPTGASEYRVRLVTAGGAFVEQTFHIVPHDGQLGVVYTAP